MLSKNHVLTWLAGHSDLDDCLNPEIQLVAALAAIAVPLVTMWEWFKKDQTATKTDNS